MSKDRESRALDWGGSSTELDICRNPELSSFWPKVTGYLKGDAGPRKGSLFLVHHNTDEEDDMTPPVLNTEVKDQGRGEMLCVFSAIPSLLGFLNLTVSILLPMEGKMTTRISFESWQQSSGFY